MLSRICKGQDEYGFQRSCIYRRNEIQLEM